MRKGFSLLELLVASLLFGMLMTILTMVFNQSSIAWRTGIAGLSDLDKVRETVGQVRNEADNVYIWKNNNPQITSIVSIWRSDAGTKTGAAKLRNRAIDTGDGDIKEGEKIRLLESYINASGAGAKAGDIITQSAIPCGQDQNSADRTTYTVNVRSAGPDRKHNTYDDIWSYPDDFAL